MFPHRRLLPPIALLLAFEAAARHGSVSRAAAELHLTQSAVSRQIRLLEQQLGVALFHRVRQRVVLTDAGRLYAVDLRDGLESLSNATRRVSSYGGPGGVLNLAVLPTFGTRWLIPRMPRFTARQPNATVNFAARTEPFDFEREPFDAAIHYGPPVWSGASCERLLGEHVVPACSPAFRDAHRIDARTDLLAVPRLQQSTRPTLWAEWLEQAGVDATLAMHGPRFEQFAMIAQAAAAGMGVALLPRFLIEEELAHDRLVVLFDDVLADEQAYYLVIPEARAETPLVRAFREWILAEASLA